jgi:hypothetical protein
MLVAVGENRKMAYHKRQSQSAARERALTLKTNMFVPSLSLRKIVLEFCADRVEVGAQVRQNVISMNEYSESRVLEDMMGTRYARDLWPSNQSLPGRLYNINQSGKIGHP